MEITPKFYNIPDSKELNINFLVDSSNGKTLVQNLDSSKLFVELYSQKATFAPVVWNISGKTEVLFNCSLNHKEYGSNIDSIIFSKYGKIHCYNFDPIKNQFIKILPVEYNLMDPIIFLTGHSGGGTSIVAKSFKYLGLHLGDDSGIFSNRKNHESYTFRHWNGQFFSKGIKDNLDVVFSAFNYSPNKVNVFKLPDLSGQTAELGNLFPNSKFVSVVKHKSKNTLSTEGGRFNNKNDFEVYKEQHPPVEGNPMFHMDWVRYFTDYQYANKVLNFIGANIVLNEDSFNLMLQEINFDNSRLKKM